jgi:hypothetical protein
MSATAKQLEQNERSWSNRALPLIIIANLVGNYSESAGLLPEPVGLLLAYFVVFTIGYWIGPRPPLGFGKFTFRLAVAQGLILLGLWTVPQLLIKVLWWPLAHGLPALAVAIAFYWMPPVYPTQKKPVRFSVWLIGSLAVVGLLVWLQKP